MKKLVLILALSAAVSACGSREQKPSAQYEQKKASLEDMERDSPLKFLRVTASLRGNLINQTVVEGEIINKATLVSYKNIKLQIAFADNDGKVVDKQKETIDETVKPGASTSFKIKTSHVKGASTVNVEVADATPDK